MHAASIYYVHHHFSLANQGRAQAMYSSLGFGLGGSLGALLMASLVDSLGYEGLFGSLDFVWPVTPCKELVRKSRKSLLPVFPLIVI